MGSLESEGLSTTISSSLSIPELINIIRYSFLECEFNEVQNILVGREQKMKFEIESLVRDRDSINKELRLLERRQGIAELQKIKFEERLKKSDEECGGLREKIKNLTEEQNLCGAEKKYVKLREENAKMLNDKNKMIFELIEKINELKNEKFESERSVGVYQERLKALQVRVVEMDQEIENLRIEKIAAYKTVEECRQRQLEADREIEELRLKKLESDKVTEVNKRILETLLPRITMVEENLASVFNVSVKDLPSLADKIKDSSATQEQEHGSSSDAKAENPCSGNGSTQSVGSTECVGDADAENEFVMSPGVNSGYHSPEGGSNGLSGKDGTLPVVEPLVLEARSSAKMANACATAANIIEIIDSDDEGNPGASNIPMVAIENNFTSNIHVNDDDDDKLVISANFVEGPSSSPANKQERTKHIKGSFTNFSLKRKRSACESENDNIPIEGQKKVRVLESTLERLEITSQTPLQKLDSGKDRHLIDSEDESCSDSDLDKLVAGCGTLNGCKKWLFEADILKAFEEDAELGMDAVCALYRQKIFAAKSNQCCSLYKTEGFSHVDAVSGCALAEYLIDGDPELKLRKSIAEVRQHHPDVLTQCKRLATTYHEKLFKIYCNKDDPFFGRQ